MHKITLLRLMVLAVALLTLLTALPASAAVFRVGGDAACNFNSLQEALDHTLANGSGYDQIFLANNVEDMAYFGWYLSEDQSVMLRGGYASCAAPTPSTTTKMVRDSGTRNFLIQTGIPISGVHVVRLENLDLISDGTGPSGWSEGDSIHLSGSNRLALLNTQILDARADIGAAIFFDATEGAILDLEEGAFIGNSEAAEAGGGVACLGPGHILMHDGSTVFSNKSQRGGGFYLEGGCTLYVLEQGPYSGIIENAADEGGEHSIFKDTDFQLFGGGVGGSTWRCLLLPSYLYDPGVVPVRFGDPDFINEADRDFRLGTNSLAVDFCDTYAGWAMLDRAGEPRPVDSAVPVTNTWGEYDAGAFERQE